VENEPHHAPTYVTGPNSPDEIFDHVEPISAIPVQTEDTWHDSDDFSRDDAPSLTPDKALGQTCHLGRPHWDKLDALSPQVEAAQRRQEPQRLGERRQSVPPEREPGQSTKLAEFGWYVPDCTAAQLEFFESDALTDGRQTIRVLAEIVNSAEAQFPQRCQRGKDPETGTLKIATHPKPQNFQSVGERSWQIDHVALFEVQLEKAVESSEISRNDDIIGTTVDPLNVEVNQ
jgi:hypothetical protein